MILGELYWPGLKADVSRFYRSCEICQKMIAKGKEPKVPLQMPLIDVLFKRIAVNIFGPILIHQEMKDTSTY